LRREEKKSGQTVSNGAQKEIPLQDVSRRNRERYWKEEDVGGGGGDRGKFSCGLNARVDSGGLKERSIRG